MACGCFHSYEYVVDDPGNVLNSSNNGKSMFLFVPVGGQTVVFSTKRYNAMADALSGNKLPKVNIPFKLGEVDTYPTTPQTLEGKPIPQDDQVFTKTPVYRTSDVANVSFSLTTSSSETDTQASSYSYGATLAVGGGASVFSATLSADHSWSLDQSYSVTVGKSTSFSGSVQPVRDDPTTPENESLLYGYSFQPYVYRQPFMQDAVDGGTQNGAYYVMAYSVGK
jgi:hypothetical protein